MKTIHFRNSKQWTDVCVTSYNSDESQSEVINLKKQDTDSDFVLEFDNDKYPRKFHWRKHLRKGNIRRYGFVGK